MSSSKEKLREIHVLEKNPLYRGNQIKTAKYNIFTFFPVALAYQYKNYFNIYFLVVAIILGIKKISRMSWTIGVIPYIVVLGFSLIREGVEDYKKSQYDKKYNSSASEKYSKQHKNFVPVTWQEIQVGDIIKVNRNEPIPCDIIMIKSANKNGLAYLETSNLDGENALKPRQSLECVNMDTIDTTQYTVFVEEPNKNIYDVKGYIISKDIKKTFVQIQNILLRGGFLKNVEYAYGIVIYTGADTKLMKNINNQNYKKSSLERLENKIVIYLILLTALICIGGAIGGSYRQIWLYDHNAFYLFDYGNHKLKKVEEGFLFFGTYFVIFNNIIPICLLIALEVVKAIQVIIISFDDKLQLNNDQFKVLSLRLQEDLGSVKYIFSDKTGTLTKNEMVFRGCSIYSKLYNGEGYTMAKKKSAKKSFFSEKFSKEELIHALSSDQTIELMIGENSPFGTIGEVTKFFFLNIALNHGVLTEEKNEEGQNGKKELDYQGTNPDELTLVRAANELGIKFISRKDETISIFEAESGTKFYTVLHLFEFSSERLRSSILVRDPILRKIILFMKGADSVMLSRKTLDEFSYKNVMPKTKEHIDQFARQGFRTLCYAMKFVDEKDYEKFHKEYVDLKTRSILDKSLLPQVEKKIEEIESNMILLGATSLEDKLQDSVRKDMQEFIDAGINIWMLTGDKVDTAESIAFSCKLFNDETEIMKIMNKETPQNIESIFDSILEKNKMKEEIKKNVKMMQKEKFEKITKEMKFDKAEFAKKNKLFISTIREEFEENKEAVEVNKSIDLGKIPYKKAEPEKGKRKRPSSSLPRKNRKPKKTPSDSNDQDNAKSKGKLLLKEESNKTIKNTENDIQHKPSFKIPDREILDFMLNQNYFGTETNRVITERNVHRTNSNTVTGRGDEETKIVNERGKNKEDLNKEIPSVEESVDKNSLGSVLEDAYRDSDSYSRDLKINKYDNHLPIHDISPKENQDNHVADELMDKYAKELVHISKLKEENEGIKLRHMKKFEINVFNYGEQALNVSLIIEGESISECVNNEKLKDKFLKVIPLCRSVVCCRCAPKQKSGIVNFIKSNRPIPYGMTLAIGDGGNDVDMLKEADIGIGIFGQEGSQAAFNSDYAISKFKYLKRLLFYHGRYYLMRNSYFIYSFFYKSIIYAMPNFWFLFSNSYSSTIIYDDAQFLIYNALGSNFLVAIRAVFEEDIDMDFEGFPKKNEMKKLVSDIYREYRDRVPFSPIRFVLVFFGSLFHSAMIYYIPTIALKYNIADSSGRINDHWSFALIAYTNIIVYQALVTANDSNFFCWFTWVAYGLHALCNFLTVFLKNYTPKDDQCSGITVYLWGTGNFWFITILTTLIGYLPYYVITKFETFFVYDIINGLRYDKYKYDLEKKKYIKKFEHAKKLKRILSKFRDIYDGESDIKNNFRDKKLLELVKKYKRTTKSIICEAEGEDEKEMRRVEVSEGVRYNYPEEALRKDLIGVVNDELNMNRTNSFHDVTNALEEEEYEVDIVEGKEE